MSHRWLTLALALALVAANLTPAFAQPQAPAAADRSEVDAADDDIDVDDDAGETTPKSEDGKAPPNAPAAADEDSAAEGAGDDESDLADAELEGEDITKPPAKGKGAIAGIVTDTKFEEPLVEAVVAVLGTKITAFTDIEGRYRLELPPGTYQLRVGYELHRSNRVEGVVVKAGSIMRLDHKLVPDESSVDEVVVEAVLEHESGDWQALARKRAPAVSDRLGRSEIARTPDRNAAEAAKRIVGATVVGGRFVYVRGLGERYTNSLLNGVPLPSPEPDRQAVPLDLFPALVLESIEITKQFTPDMPADFAGGSVLVRTRDFPNQRLIQVSVNVGYNSNATFRKRLNHHGGSGEWVGAGGRSLPDDFPKTKLDDSAATPEQRVRWGRQVNSYMSTLRSGTPPNHGISVVAGDSMKLGADTKLGGIAALSYGRSFEIRHVRSQRFVAESLNKPQLREAAEGETGLDTVRLGAFASASLEPSRNHSFSVTGFRSQSADKLTADLEGFRDSAAATLRNLHLEYLTRVLNFAQLRGRHDFPGLNKSALDWNLALSSANRDQPDTRDVVYRRRDDPSDPGYDFTAGTQSGAHLFSELAETTRGGGINYTQPILRGEKTETKIKLGGLVSLRKRESSTRRFVLEPESRPTAPPPAGFTEATQCEPTWSGSCPDRLFRDRFIAQPNGLVFRETTQVYDEYNAKLDVWAGYVMLDTIPLEQLRFILGARVEDTHQSFEAYDPFNREGTLITSGIDSTDVLPALAAVFAVSPRTNTRFGIGETLARPQLREITPFLSYSYTADFPIQGYADLKLTKITNVDLRFEHMPTLAEVLAFSFFYKRFKDPIEQIVLAGPQSIYTYRNAPSADLIGLELEGRKSLAPFAQALKDFSVMGNLTLVRSRVNLGRQRGNSTNVSRPLSYQSPYVVNGAIDYSNAGIGFDARILYNVYGPRIVSVGADLLPDVYEKPRHTLDASVSKKLGKSFELKLTGQNLLRAKIEYELRDSTGYREDRTTGTLSPIGIDPDTLSEETATVVTFGATYTY